MNTQLYYAYRWATTHQIAAESVEWNAEVYQSLESAGYASLLQESDRRLVGLHPRYSELTYPSLAAWVSISLPYKAQLIPSRHPLVTLQVASVPESLQTSLLAIQAPTSVDAGASNVGGSCVAKRPVVEGLLGAYASGAADILYSRRPLNAPVTSKYSVVDGYVEAAETAIHSVKQAASWTQTKTHIPAISRLQNVMFDKRLDFVERYLGDIDSEPVLAGPSMADMALDAAFHSETGSHRREARVAYLAAARSAMHHSALIGHTSWLSHSPAVFEHRVRAAEYRADLLRVWARKVLFAGYLMHVNVQHAALVKEYLGT